jgi:hypothetical protein
MHIHSSHMSPQMMGLAASQSTQRAAETRKAAAAVRRKLSLIAGSAEFDRLQEVDAGSDSPDGSRQEPQPEEDSFKHFFSVTA